MQDWTRLIKRLEQLGRKLEREQDKLAKYRACSAAYDEYSAVDLSAKERKYLEKHS